MDLLAESATGAAPIGFLTPGSTRREAAISARTGRQRQVAQVNPLDDPHPAAEKPPPRDPVSTFTAEKLRSTFAEPHATQGGRTPPSE